MNSSKNKFFLVKKVLFQLKRRWTIYKESHGGAAGVLSRRSNASLKSGKKSGLSCAGPDGKSLLAQNVRTSTPEPINNAEPLLSNVSNVSTSL